MSRQKRKRTPERHVRLLHKRQRGICATADCGAALHLEKPRNFIIEHDHALGRGGTDLLKNKSLRCYPCALAKTFHPRSLATTLGGDNYEAKKTERLLRGGRKRKGPKMKSRPFPKANRSLSGKRPWPKRAMRPTGSRGDRC